MSTSATFNAQTLGLLVKVPQELIDDAECIAGLRLISVTTSTARGASIASYHYPEQEFKLHEGDSCNRTDTAQGLGTLGAINEDERTVEIRISQKKEIFRICVFLVFKPLPQSAIVMAQMEDSSGPHTSKNTAPWNLAQTPLLRDKKLCRFIIGNFLLSDKKAPKNKVLPTNFVKVLNP